MSTRIPSFDSHSGLIGLSAWSDIRSHFPTQGQVNSGAHRIQDKRFGKTSVSGKLGGSAGSPGRQRGLRGSLHIFPFHTEMVDPFATIARRQNREIDVAVG